MIRSVLAVVVGVVAWIATATVLNLGQRYALPGYAAAEPSMVFTFAMMIGRLVVGLASSVVAGFACSWVARGASPAVRVFAALMLCLLSALHAKLWHAFPVWYHLFFLLTLVPAILAGVALQRRLAAGSSGMVENEGRRI
jgi:peptidoglycan/LPS O-acetylase OafA/YrhL